MTIIVGQLIGNTYALAADGRVTDSNGDIHNEKCEKIEYFGDYCIAGAGDCSSIADIKKFILHSRETSIPLDLLNFETIGGSDGAAIVLQLSQQNPTMCLAVYQLEIDSTSSNFRVRNLLLEGEDFTLLGCGATAYRGANMVLERSNEGKPTNLDGVINNMTRCFEAVALVNSACNDNITLRTFTILNKDT